MSSLKPSPADALLITNLDRLVADVRALHERAALTDIERELVDVALATIHATISSAIVRRMLAEHAARVAESARKREERYEAHNRRRRAAAAERRRDGWRYPCDAAQVSEPVQPLDVNALPRWGSR
jgi:hypothetical protein